MTIYEIDIWDYNYSMSYSVLYHFDNDSLIVKRIGTLVGEIDTIIKARKLTVEEKETIIKFLKSFPIESVKDKYENKYVEDGNQMKINLKINNITKSTIISNVYQPDFAELFRSFNFLLEEDLKIVFEEK